MFELGSNIIFRYSALDVSVRGRECGYIFTEKQLSCEELKFMKNVDINTRGSIVEHIKRRGEENNTRVRLADGRFIVVPTWVLGVI